MEQLQQIGDTPFCYEVKHPNEHADAQNASANDQGVLQDLLGGGPNDLLQFAAQLTEVSANAAPGSFEPVFLLNFCQDDRPPYFVSL